MGLVPRYIVLEGFCRRFTALKIVKTEAGFFLKKKDYIKPFAIKDRPVLTECYQILHDYKRKNVVKATKKRRWNGISPLSKFEVLRFDVVEKELENIRKELQNTNPKLLKEIDDWLDYIGRLDEKTVEKIVDEPYLKLIDNLPDSPTYVHPMVSKRMNGLPTVHSLEELFETLKSIIEQKFVPSEDFGDRTGSIKTRVKDWLKRGDRFGKVRMTDPINSELKYGQCNFVCNFRYLEFLRECEDNNCRVKIFAKDCRKFIIAVGKAYKKDWYPEMAELYVFDVTEFDEKQIEYLARKLERTIILVLAEKFRVPEEWFNGIQGCILNLIGKCKDEKSLDKLGVYGGLVYLAYQIPLEEFSHKPMDSTEVQEYLRGLLINLQNDFIKLEEIISKGEIPNFDVNGCKDLEDFLDSLKGWLENLRNILSSKEAFSIPRPFNLERILKNGIFNCEVGVYFAMYILLRFGAKFNIKSIKLVLIPQTYLKGILSKHYSHLKGDYKMICEYYNATIEYDHVVLVINNKIIFDPTNLLFNIYNYFC